MEHIYKYCETIRSNSGVNFFWSIKNSGAILDKFSTINHKASSLDVFDFSTLYTSLPHQKINDQLKNFIKWTFSSEDKLFICTNYFNGFFSNKSYTSYKSWPSGELIDALCFLLDNIFIQFDNAIYRQIVGIHPYGYKLCSSHS